MFTELKAMFTGPKAILRQQSRNFGKSKQRKGALPGSRESAPFSYQIRGIYYFFPCSFNLAVKAAALSAASFSASGVA